MAGKRELNVKRALQKYNEDGDGFFSRDELQGVLKAVGTTDSDIDGFFSVLDASSGGCISISELLNWMYASDRDAAMHYSDIANESARQVWTCSACSSANHPLASECRLCSHKIAGIDKARIELAQLKMTKEEHDAVMKVCDSETHTESQDDMTWKQQVQTARRMSWQQKVVFSEAEVAVMKKSSGASFEDMTDGVKIELARTIVPHMRYLSSLSKSEQAAVEAEADCQGTQRFQNMSWATKAYFASKTVQQVRCFAALTESEIELSAIKSAAGESFKDMSIVQKVDLARAIVPNMRYLARRSSSEMLAIEAEAERQAKGSFQQMDWAAKADFASKVVHKLNAK